MIEDQFPNAVVHNYYLCNSKYCTDISANEATRLKGEKKNFYILGYKIKKMCGSALSKVLAIFV